MSALLLLYQQGGQTQEVPFVCRDGHLMKLVDEIADYMVTAGLGDSLWETIAGERLNVILAQKLRINEMAQTIAQLKEWADMFGPASSGLLQEVASG